MPRTASSKRSYGKFAEISTEDEADNSNQANNVVFEHVDMENFSSEDSLDVETTKPNIKIQKDETLNTPIEASLLPIVAASPSTFSSTTITNEKSIDKCKRSRVDDQESIDTITTAFLSAVRKVTCNIGTPASRNITESFIKLYSDQMYRLFENRSEKVQRQLRNRFSVFMDDLFEEFEL